MIKGSIPALVTPFKDGAVDMDTLKKLQRDGDISEDEQRAWETDLQKLTDDIIKHIDESLSAKEIEIMQV